MNLVARISLLLLLVTIQLVSCNTLPTKTVHDLHARSTSTGVPTHAAILSKRDDLDQEEIDDLDLYQNWASMCRNGVNNNNALIAATVSDQDAAAVAATATVDNLSLNNLWKTVTETVNCGGGHAMTVTRTTTVSKSTSTSNPSSNSSKRGKKSCTGQCWSDYLWHTYGDSISPAQGFAGIVCILVGLYFQILGFRFFRPTLALVGFVFFATMTWIGLVNNEPAGGYPLGDLIYICVSAGLGILGAIILVFLWPVGIYCLACLGGFYFAVYILSWKEDLVITIKVARICFIIGLSLLGPVLLFFAESYMVLFTTALMGSHLFYFGLDFFAHTGFINPWLLIFDGNPKHHNVYLMSKPVYVMLAFVIVSTLISFGWQYYYCIVCLKIKFGINSPKEPEPKKEEPEKEEPAPQYMCVPPPYYSPQPMFLQNVNAAHYGQVPHC
ncbi:unnamed protein product [Mucor circinelloides]|uniref:Transmembrane protein 198 n=1 Tax=Mucor circinelloides f. circinelloides (strain 1006PhL) TaxID=1220926 RepID=S2JQU8_MUCC1|nr:hypothetical protein HMPREF1544_08318 [Mucor circinelloides 1006PhL]